jgi:hypothetical protein
MTFNTRHLTRGARHVALAASVLLGASCSDFLVADNPGAVKATDVNDPAYVALIANAPIFAFQNAIDDVTYWNAQFTDELWNRAVFVEEGQIDRRDLYSEMSYITAFMYNPMQRARFLAEDAARRLKTIIPSDSSGRFLPIGRAHAYAALNYVTLGEMMCTTPIDLGVPRDWDTMMNNAISHADTAITIATATKAFLNSQTTVNANLVAQADSVIRLASVVAARAALNRGENARATTYAGAVPATGWEFREYYHDNTTAQLHRTYERLQLGSNATMLNTPFMAKTGDPRLPRINSTSGTNGKPLSPPSYSSFNNTVAGAPLVAQMGFRIASSLEAQYVIHEANPTTLAAVTFIDSRRAAGLQGPSGIAVGDAAAVRAELREQRSRDFYLDNHRLGDLRRYIKLYNVNLFEQGAYPGSTTGQIFNPTTFCWPLPTSEINDNPNIPKG